MTLSGSGALSGGGLPGVMPDPPLPMPPASAPAPAAAPAAPAAVGGGDPPAALATPTAGGASAPIDGAAAPTGDQPAGAEAPVDPNAQPFTFDGKQYASQAAAENFLRSQNGRVAALSKQAGEYAGVLKAWMDWGNGLAAENARLKGSQPSQGATTPAQPASPQSWVDGLDWEFYGELASQHGPEFAGHWLIQRMEERLEAKLADRFKPIEQGNAASAERQQFIDQSVNAFEAVRVLTDDAGNLLYPELSNEDPAVHGPVMEKWRTLPRELQLTERGIAIAVREARAESGGAPPRPAPGTQGAPPSPSQILRASETAAAQPLQGSGVPRPAAAAAPGGASLRQQIMAADMPRTLEGGKSLGFAP